MINYISVATDCYETKNSLFPHLTADDGITQIEESEIQLIVTRSILGYMVVSQTQYRLFIYAPLGYGGRPISLTLRSK